MAQLQNRPVSRRSVVTAGAAGAAGILASAGWRTRPADAATPQRPDLRLTVMGTTDLHGNALNWDYYSNKEYDDADSNDVGLAKVSTLISAVRADRGRGHTLMLDAGDTIQGTPLASYFAKIKPITKGGVHPMAAAMNAIGYDAAALGNHEFNYGIPLLRKFQQQLDFPLLGANAVHWGSREPAFRPYVIKRVRIGNHKPVVVGILGLTNPGIAIWDKANVEGKMRFPGLVERAKMYVPQLKALGAEVVILAAHSGADTSSSYGDALPYPENASTLVAEEVNGIDAILVGHAHVEIAERYVTNKKTGKQVLLTEPLKWGMRLSVMDLDLQLVNGRWTVEAARSQVLNSNTVEDDPKIARIVQKAHTDVVDYVNSKIGTCKDAMSAKTAPYEDTAALDFINYVQADAVKTDLNTDTPVLSIAAPFNRDAAIPAGDVSVRDVAGLYIFDNTLLGINFTGAQVKAYLEKSAEYFKQVSGTGPFTPDEVTNAPTGSAPGGTPDYNYDVMGGLDAPLTYDIDISEPVGQRILNLAYDGKPVADDAAFVIAINNYRQSGGGGFPGVTDAEVVYNRQIDIRQLLIDWVTTKGEIDPAEFSTMDWKLVSGGQPIQIKD